MSEESIMQKPYKGSGCVERIGVDIGVYQNSNNFGVYSLNLTRSFYLRKSSMAAGLVGHG